MAEEKRRATASRNILVFGQTGAGKSSIINMLQGKLVDWASDDATNCTQHHRIPDRDGTTHIFWNTPDLNESFPVKSHDAVRDLQSLVNEYRFDLLVYCIEDGRVEKIRFNYYLVWRDICKERVPIVLVVAGLRENPDEWWYENEEKIEEMKMSFDGHVCIPSWTNRDNEGYAAEELWRLVRAYTGTNRNVILFGEAGCGKSSIVNMIVGKDVAKVSSGLKGCTFHNDEYEANIGGKHFVIYDTAGLNEGEHGRVPHWKAIRALYMLIRRLNGVSLLVYCMRGRVRDNAKANWILFNKVICGGNVPIVAIVTGLEDYGDPDEFLKDKNNSGVFRENGMEPKEVGCVVSFRGKQDIYADTYVKSQVKVRNLVTMHCLQESWSVEKGYWFASIYSEAYESGLCFTTRNRLDYSTQMRKALDDFVRETGMRKEDYKKLRVILKEAEKKYRGWLEGFLSNLIN